MMTEGYIKFSVHLNETEIQVPEALQALNATRTILFDAGMIGILPDGIGFGNVSIKEAGSGIFFISGTATGGKRILAHQDYCRVDACSVERNEVYCSGHIRASAETLSHYAVYQANPAIQCVIHIHHKAFFQQLLKSDCPATSADAAYGTPEMARDIEALVKRNPEPHGILVMTGHEDGVIAWGRTIAEAYDTLMSHFLFHEQH
jgi:ribulose-5-phosphate 4-epimerase/fuculose-1-phosphate aldolase